MDVEVEEGEDFYLISVESDSRVAVVLDTEDGERIFLPSGEEEGSCYYGEDAGKLVETGSGYFLRFEGEFTNLEVLS